MLVETVGVGQSETAVRSMTDFFLLLMLAGAGDELQGIKRGIIEMVDGMAITKADGDNRHAAERARVEYKGALHLFPAPADGWTPRVLTCSALADEGIEAVWAMVLEHRDLLTSNGHLAQRRRQQAREWLHELILSGLRDLIYSDSRSRDRLVELEAAVTAGATSAFTAARVILDDFRTAR